MNLDALGNIQTAIHGLFYPSEAGSLFEIVQWEQRAAIRSSADWVDSIASSSGLPVEEVSLDEFFWDLIQDRDWHDADGKQTVERYRHLLSVLQEHLSDLKVFTVGEDEIDIYIVGRTAAGDWAGIMTTAVET